MAKDILKLLVLLAIIVFISMCISISVGLFAQGFLMFSKEASLFLTVLIFCGSMGVIGHKTLNSKNKFINFFF